jgi:hypothetical protein
MPDQKEGNNRNRKWTDAVAKWGPLVVSTARFIWDAVKPFLGH